MRSSIILFCLAASVAFSSSAIAQPTLHRHRHAITSIGYKVKPKAPKTQHHTTLAAKTTATDIRLSSSVELEYDGTMYEALDSTTYAYTGTKGGYFDDMWYWWDWHYDVAKSYEYYAPTYDTSSRTTLTYDAAGNITTELREVWDNFMLVWENQSKITNTYDASNKLITSIEQDWNSSTSSWDNYQRTTYTYTSTDLMESYTYEDWDAGTSSWENFWKSEFSWSGSRLTEETGKWWASPGWDNWYRGTYSYDASDNRVSELAEYWSGSAYDTADITEYSGFVGTHQAQTAIYKEWDTATHTFENSEKYNITFNSDYKPTYITEEEWNASSSSWQPYVGAYATRYHYETYSTTVGIEPITDNGGTALLYPVPATTSLTISATWDAAQAFTATISDMSGRTHVTWTAAAKKKYEETFSVDQLPAGNYVLTLRGTQGTISKQFSVIK